jgi:hypothetical protein
LSWGLSMAPVVQIWDRWTCKLFSLSPICVSLVMATNDRELSSVVIHRREWDCIERRDLRSAWGQVTDPRVNIRTQTD